MKPKIHVIRHSGWKSSRYFACAEEIEVAAIEALDKGDREVFKDLAALFLEFKIRADRTMLDELKKSVQLTADPYDCIT